MTVYPRGARWGVSVYDPVTRKMRWVGTFNDEADALAAEAEASSVASDTYASRWLEYHPRKSHASNLTYAKRIRPFAERFAGIPIAELDATEVRRWAVGQAQGVRETTHTMLNDAIRDGLALGPNPLQELGSIGRRRPRRPSPLTEKELLDLAECAIDVWGQYGLEVFAPLLVTTAYLQLWVLQVCQLRRADVTSSRVRVQRIPPAVGSEWLPLKQRARAAIDAVSAGDSLWLFPNKSGRQLTPGRVFYYWSAVRAAYGRPSLTFDDLRSFRAIPTATT